METYDVIVLGLGGIGTATACELARRGRRVLGIEQFDVGHNRGSSHGETRIIRKAYYEHPDYVPLLRRAYERWYELEQQSGQRLFVECGVLSLGPADSDVVAGVLASAAEHALLVEQYRPAELSHRFPQFRIDDAWQGVLERDAGLLFVERCVSAHAEQARRYGAELHEREEVLGWRADERHVEVVTKRARYAAERLVITAGAWATRLLAGIGVPFSVMRQVAMWFAVSLPERFRRDRFPCYCADTPAGFFYGFPMLDPLGVKVARHYGAAELQDPTAVDWQIHPADETPLREFLAARLPGVDGAATRGSVCMYTLTPDRHFVIDLHPQHANVAVAGGFSGHGFKFASVVGEILADLSEGGATALPIEMFRAGRFASYGRSNTL
ncbi:MAG: N-methyl-L-tryptophan oxidase [Pirellulales bacterium]